MLFGGLFLPQPGARNPVLEVLPTFTGNLTNCQSIHLIPTIQALELFQPRPHSRFRYLQLGRVSFCVQSTRCVQRASELITITVFVNLQLLRGLHMVHNFLANLPTTAVYIYIN